MSAPDSPFIEFLRGSEYNSANLERARVPRRVHAGPGSAGLPADIQYTLTADNMTSRDKVLLYFRFALNQVLRDPLAIPHNFLRIINPVRLVRWGERRRVANEVRPGIPIPDTCVFSVTWRCNLDCKSCYAKNYTPKKELQLAEVI